MKGLGINHREAVERVMQDPIIQALFGIGMLLVVLPVLYRAMVQRHNERNKR